MAYLILMISIFSFSSTSNPPFFANACPRNRSPRRLKQVDDLEQALGGRNPDGMRVTGPSADALRGSIEKSAQRNAIAAFGCQIWLNV